MDKTKRGTKNELSLLDVVDTASMAGDTLRIARGIVMNGICGNGCDVDELTTISCVIDRAAAQLRESIAIADKMRKAQVAA
jgi:hypothetical protein